MTAENPAVTTAARRRWRLRRPLLLTFPVLALVVFGWLLTERLIGKARLAKYERELRSKGEKLTIAELVPTVPEGENGAAEVVRLCGALQEGKIIPHGAPPQMRMVAPGKAMRGASRPQWLGVGGKGRSVTNHWEEIATDMALNQQTLDALRTALKKPVLHARLNYEAGFNGLDVNHLMALKRGARWLAASGIHQIHLEDMARALEDIEALIALLRMQESEHLAINQLVRWAIQHLATALTWEAMESDAWDVKHCKRMQEAWASLDFIGPVAPSLRMERAMGRLHFEEVRHSVDKLAEVHAWRDVSPVVDALTGSSKVSAARSQIPLVDAVVGFVEKDVPKAVWKGLIFPVWQFAWSHHDQRQSWLIFQALIDATKMANEQHSASKLDEVEAELDSMSEPTGLNRLRFLLSPMSGTLRNFPKKGFQAQTHAEMVVCAIALKRYKLKHGEYPQRLDDLAPEFRAKHFTDYMDGGNLRYRQQDDDFMLWSVGSDGKDDGGNPGTLDSEGGTQPMWNAPDAVWPRPASEREIREYEERKFGR